MRRLGIRGLEVNDDSAEKPFVHPSRTSGQTPVCQSTGREARVKSLEIFRSTELVEV